MMEVTEQPGTRVDIESAGVEAGVQAGAGGPKEALSGVKPEVAVPAGSLTSPEAPLPIEGGAPGATLQPSITEPSLPPAPIETAPEGSTTIAPEQMPAEVTATAETPAVTAPVGVDAVAGAMGGDQGAHSDLESVIGGGVAPETPSQETSASEPVAGADVVSDQPALETASQIPQAPAAEPAFTGNAASYTAPKELIASPEINPSRQSEIERMLVGLTDEQLEVQFNNFERRIPQLGKDFQVASGAEASRIANEYNLVSHLSGIIVCEMERRKQMGAKTSSPEQGSQVG